MNVFIPTPYLDLELPLFVDVNGDSVDDDLDDENRLRRKRYQPKYDNTSLAPIVKGSTPSDQKMIRHLVRMIQLFLLGKTSDEIESGMPENRLETAERTNVDIHAAAVSRLREIADELDIDKDISPSKSTANDNISKAMQRISATSVATQAMFKP